MGISSFFKSLFFGKKQELLINSNTSQDRFLNNEEDFVYQPSNYIYQPPIYDEKFVTVCPYCKKRIVNFLRDKESVSSVKRPYI